MALINSGFNIDEPTDLTSPLERLIRVGFNVGREEPCEDIEIELDEPQTEEAAATNEEEEPEVIDIDINNLNEEL